MKADICSDDVFEMLTVNASLESERVYVRISFINDGKDTVNILYQVRDDYKYGVQTRMKIHLPLLENRGRKMPGRQCFMHTLLSKNEKL